MVNKEGVKQKSNLIAFRASEVELAQINSLQKLWRLDNKSMVLHRLLANYEGYSVVRQGKIADIRQDMQKWDISTWELV